MPLKVNILTNNSCPNSRAFNCPLLATSHIFRTNGWHLRFHFHSPNPEVYKCDILFINSNVFRPLWAKNKDKIFKFLEAAAEMNLKIVWFDTTDSTWCTQFEVMPYVDLFLKGQLLKNRQHYLKPFRTGRIFTDFFDNLYRSGEKAVDYPAAKPKDLAKMALSWNTCFENYNESRYGLPAKIGQWMRPQLANFRPGRLHLRFTSPARKREIPISCRVGTSHSRPSVIAHRQAVLESLAEFNINGDKITLSEYFSELRNSQIAVSPFGVGEITLRDFEIIICGAALVKPDMSHMETWPELFQAGKSFAPHAWDLSDLPAVIENLRQDDDYRRSLAEEARNIYRQAVSQAGQAEFVKHLMHLIEDKPEAN